MTLNFIMNKYRVLGKKGEGTFSEVLKCQNIQDGSLWACKKMKQHYESIEQVNNLREIQAMRRLSPHQNILELHEVAFDKKSGTLVLICELMDMNIYELIRGRRHYLPEKKVKAFMYQLLRSINHMHRNGIFHRDVKPENILIKSTAKDDHLKLADFGSCRSVYSKPPYTEYISTRWYRAPECLLTDGFYSYKMDIWSVGCVFFEIMSLHPLFPGSNEVDQIAKIHDIMGTPDPSILNKLRNKTRGMNFNFPQKKGNGFEKMLPHASQECIELIKLMCTYDPDERITAKQALKHHYFKELRDSEKRALAQAKLQKKQEESKSLPAADTENVAPSVITNGSEEKSQEPAVQNTETKKSNANPPPKSPKQPVRPKSGGSETISNKINKYPGVLSNREQLFNYHRRERDRKKRKLKRMTESDSGVQSSAVLLPKVNTNKPSSYQPPYQSSGLTSSGLTSSHLPKLGPAGSSSYLPSISQAFIKPAKPGKAQATKNAYGHYQLPSIDRRGAGH